MTTPDATQPGVSNEANEQTDEQTKAPEPSARELAMEAIAVRREGIDGAEIDQAALQTEQQTEQAATPPLDSTPKVLMFDQDKTLVKVKIDGVESMVTVEEMARQFQKNGAAERRLEEATRLLNEARQQSQAMQAPPVVVAPATAKDDITTTQSDQGGKEFLAALFEGDEDRALTALSKVLGGRQQPTQNEDELIAKLTPQIKQQLIAESALEKFAVDFADVVQDPYLAQMADEFLDAEVAGGKPYAEALESAGKKTRDWLASKGVTPPAIPPTTSRNAKLERKEGIDQIPALHTKAVTQEDPVQTASDVINEMRKARGLLV